MLRTVPLSVSFLFLILVSVFSAPADPEKGGAPGVIDTQAPVMGSDLVIANTNSSTSTALSLTLTWGSASDNVTPTERIAYKVVMGLAATDVSTTTKANALTGPAVVMDWTMSVATTTFSTGLSPHTNYWFAVVTKDAVGNLALSKVTLYTPVAADTMVRMDGSNATNGFGGKDTLFIKNSTVNARVPYLRFDLASVSGASVTKALLQFAVYRDASTAAANQTVSVTGLTASASQTWIEGTTNGTPAGPGELTWATQPTEMGTVLDSTTITDSVGTTPTYVTLDLTKFVNGQLAVGNKVFTLKFTGNLAVSTLMGILSKESIGLRAPFLTITH